MKLPPLRNPLQYVGLYVLDFGDRVAAGYTAQEVALLLATKEYESAKAFRIHRVDERGCVELAGVSGRDVMQRDILVFAFDSAEQAGRGFSRLRQLAQQTPAPCACAMEWVDFADVDPPNAVCLTFAQSASGGLSSWLEAVGFDAGSRVYGGPRLLGRYRAAALQPIAQCTLVAVADYAPRSIDELRDSIDQPLQR